MSPADETPPEWSAAHEHLRHALLTPLTVVLARAQLVVRDAQRSPTLGAAERARLMANMAAIEAAVQVLVATIEAMDRRQRGGDDLGSADQDTERRLG
jgi:hypothetical protein